MRYHSKVLQRREPESPRTREWLSSLEGRYDVWSGNPYARVYSFRKGIYSILIESADGMGDTWVHLIVGKEKALLIDTSFGIGDLKGLVNKLTGGLPLLVANTHSHLDHVMGNYQFDKVHCLTYGVQAMEKFFTPTVWDKLFDQTGKGIWYDFNKEDVIPYRKYEIVPCQPHFMFDLGEGHLIEMIHTPGHSPDGASFLDHKNKILFTGAMHTNGISIIQRPGHSQHPYGHEFGTVHAFRDSLLDLKNRINEIDAVFPAHEILELGPQFILDQLSACNCVLQDPHLYDSVREREWGLEYCKWYGQAGLRYTMESLV